MLPPLSIKIKYGLLLNIIFKPKNLKVLNNKRLLEIQNLLAKHSKRGDLDNIQLDKIGTKLKIKYNLYTYIDLLFL